MSDKMRILWGVIFFLALFRMFAAPVLAKDLSMKSPWIMQPLKIDGQLSDWPESAAIFLKDPEATVGICNDSERVYIRLSFRNQDWARLIRMGGVTVWLDGMGKKGKQFMLRFNDGPAMEELMNHSGSGGQDQRPGGFPGQKSGIGREPEVNLICYQKNYLEEKVIPADGSQGPSAAYGTDHDFYIYEFSVPLKKSMPMSYGLGMTPTKAINVGFIWGEMDKSRMRRERPNMGGGMIPGGMGGGGGRPSPGGMSGGPGGPSGMGREMPKKQEFWLKAELTESSSTERQSTKAEDKK